MEELVEQLRDSVKMPDGQMLHYDIKVKGLQPWQW
jgi:hypothetical protein